MERRFALGAEGLDQALVEAAVGVPVEVAQVVAGCVGLVVGELEAARLGGARDRRVAGSLGDAVLGGEAEAVELAQERAAR